MLNELFFLMAIVLLQNVMEQFNPGLRNLINLGKSYEKSFNGELFFSPTVLSATVIGSQRFDKQTKFKKI